MLSFDEFSLRFAAQFVPDRDDRVSESTGLFDELGLDSLDAFRLVLFVETLSDIGFPPLEIPPMYTVDDAYGYYRMLCGLVREQRSVSH